MSSSARPWVLVAEGGHGESRAAVAAARILDTTGRSVAVTVSDRLSLAGSSRHCRRRVTAPLVADDPSRFAVAVRAELAARDYLTVLPASDAALVALDLPGAQLANKGVVLERAQSVGLRVPPTVVASTVGDAIAAARSFGFPVAVKPDVKRVLARRVDSPADFDRLPAETFPALVQPFLPDGLHGLLGVMWQGRLVVAAHLSYLRVWPWPCGTVAAAVTVPPDPDLERRLERLLPDYDGPMHVDLAGGRLLDLNLRVHASAPVAQAAGADVVGGYCDLLEGAAPVVRRARPGVAFRWLEGDLRSLASSVRRGGMPLRDALVAAGPRRGVVHSYASIADPGPSLAWMAYLARRARHRLAAS